MDSFVVECGLVDEMSYHRELCRITANDGRKCFLLLCDRQCILVPDNARNWAGGAQHGTPKYHSELRRRPGSFLCIALDVEQIYSLANVEDALMLNCAA